MMAVFKTAVVALLLIFGTSYAYSGPPPGTQKRAFLTGGNLRSSPAIGLDGTIYVGSYDNNLHAMNGDSGGLADRPWPMFRQNVRHTGRMDISVPPHHDADYNQPAWSINLSELLRVIQFYNIGEYDCDSQGENGYAPGPKNN